MFVATITPPAVTALPILSEDTAGVASSTWVARAFSKTWLPAKLLNRSWRVDVRRARPEHPSVGLKHLNAAVGALVPVGMGIDRVTDS